MIPFNQRRQAPVLMPPAVPAAPAEQFPPVQGPFITPPMTIMTRMMVTLHARRPDHRRVTLLTFFGDDWRWTPQRLRLLAQLEEEWEPRFIPRDVTAGGSLRPYIWTMTVPNPQIHWNECVKRFPRLASYPTVKEFFLSNPRAQPALRLPNEPQNRRCPMCGCHVFGFHIENHGGETCPIRQHTNRRDRFELAMINHLGFCLACHSRSPAHSGCTKINDPCTNCNTTGHSRMLGICSHPAKENIERMREAVQNIRSEYYAYVRRRWDIPENRLKYETIFDVSHHQTFRRYERRNNRPVDSVGSYQDPNGVYSTFPQDLLTNNAGPTKYPGLEVPELRNRSLTVPIWSEEDYNFLSQIGALIRNLPDNDEELWELIPQLPEYAAIQRGVRPPRLHEQARIRHAPEQHQQNEGNEHIPRDAPANEDNVDRVAEGNEHIPRDAPANEANIDHVAEEMNLEDVNNDAPAAEIQANRENDASENEEYSEADSLPDTDSDLDLNETVVEVRPQQALPVATDTTVQPLMARRSDNAAEQIIAQPSNAPAPVIMAPQQMQGVADFYHQSDNNLRMTAGCHEMYMVNKKPVRLSYQREPARRAKKAGLPITREGLVGRAQTILFILTGMPDLNRNAYTNFSNSQIINYIRGVLDRYTQILSAQPLALTRIETEREQTVLLRYSTGDQYIRVPSIALWFTEAVQRWLDVPVKNLNLKNVGKLQLQWCKADHEECTSTPAAQKAAVTLLKQQVQGIDERNRYTRVCLCLDATVPTHHQALADYINTVLSVLTNGQCRDEVHPLALPRELFEYMTMVRGAAKALKTLGQNLNTMATVTSCDATFFSRIMEQHELILPSVDSFRRYPAEMWFSYLEIVWNEALKTVKTRSCKCHGTEAHNTVL